MHKTREALTVQEAGRLGGLSTLTKYGRQFYVDIGRLGQQAMRKQHPDMASEWGKLGGRPRKPNLNDIGEQANSNKRRIGPA
jgi:general stress protein YciG